MASRLATKEVLGFDDRIFYLIGILILSFAIPLLFFKATLSNGFISYLPKWGISMLYTLAYWYTARSVIIWFRRQYPGHEETRKRLFHSAIAITLAFFAVSTIMGIVNIYLLKEQHPDGVTQIDYKVASFTIVALVTTIYESIFLYDRWKKSILEAEKLKRDHIQSQLEGLKSQVNPHFLFNSLNTLTYIIPEDPNTAVKFVQKLSKVYRYILEIRDTKLIPLKEELSFLNAYIFLLKERFGKSIEVQIDIPKDIDHCKIVPLSLQILLENAIKHNIISAKQPLKIEVFMEGDCTLVVRNNLQKKRQAMPSTKVGLENIKSRYAFFSEEKVVIQKTKEFYSVRLPLIQMESNKLGQLTVN